MRSAPSNPELELKQAGERGNMIVLGMFVWLLVILIVFAFACLSSLYLQRRELLASADSIALAAASESIESSYYGQNPAPDSSSVRSYARANAGPGERVVEPTGTRIEEEAVGGAVVVVSLETEALLPLVPEFVPFNSVTISVTSEAELRPLSR